LLIYKNTYVKYPVGSNPDESGLFRPLSAVADYLSFKNSKINDFFLNPQFINLS